MLHACSVVVQAGMLPGTTHRFTVALPDSGKTRTVAIRVPHNAAAGACLVFALEEKKEQGMDAEVIAIVQAFRISQHCHDDEQEYRFKLMPYMMTGKLLMCRSLPGRSKKLVVQVPEGAKPGEVLSFVLPIEDVLASIWPEDVYAAKRQISGVLDPEMPVEFLCPITLERMQDPVAVSDGHSYERKAILEVLRSASPVSPLTREPLDPNVIVKNRNLEKIMDEFEEDHFQEAIQARTRSSKTIVLEAEAAESDAILSIDLPKTLQELVVRDCVRKDAVRKGRMRSRDDVLSRPKQR